MQEINQAQEFLCFLVIGIIVSFIFDIFRSKRLVFKTPDLLTYFEDIIFLLISTFIILFGILTFSGGTLRFYILFSFFLGIVIYSLTISKLCVIIIKSILEILYKIIYFILNFFKKLGKIFLL